MASASFQILSDLHLETPAARPTYSDFRLRITGPYLVLLGDVGLANDGRLLTFLEAQLERFEIVFYVFGNHEPYDATWEAAKQTMRGFEDQIARRRADDDALGRFVLPDQTRYDITPGLSILGCTLFSDIDLEQASSVQLSVSDFERIQDWSVESHNVAHKVDLDWLNQQVLKISRDEPERQIVVFTHYLPTLRPEANDPRHLKDSSDMRSAFMTDLSNELCWISPAVALWAFGHTHFNHNFIDETTGKRVVANQKGYSRSEAAGFDAEKVVSISAEQDRSNTNGGSIIKLQDRHATGMHHSDAKPRRLKRLIKFLRSGT